MPTLDDEQEWVRALYYGPYGSGKTTDLAFMAKLGDVIYVRPDRGIKARRLRELGVPTDRISPIDTLDPEVLLKMTWEWGEALEEQPGSIAGVCFDTMTEYVKRRIEVQVDLGWGRVQKDAAKRHEDPDDSLRYWSDREYYNVVSQEVRRLVRRINDLPCHVALACQTRRDIDEDDMSVKYGPDVNPALQGDLMGYSDLVVRTEAVDGRDDLYLGHPRPSGKYLGKDRFMALPRILVNPTFDRVVAYVRGELESRTDPVQELYREHLRARKPKGKKNGEDE
jgi:hypothetical protein